MIMMGKSICQIWVKLMLILFQATGELVSVFAFDVKNSSESQVNSVTLTKKTNLHLKISICMCYID